jgi:hypothetical protein
MVLGTSCTQAGGHQLTDLLAAEPVPVAVWFIFRPADCSVSGDVIRMLNTLHASGAVAVSGVMLNATEAADTEQVAAAFQIDFPVQVGISSRWQEALLASGLANPVVAVKRYGVLVGVVQWNADAWLRAGLSSLLDDFGTE